MSGRFFVGSLGLFLIGVLAIPAQSLGAGIHRRSIYAIYDTWQAPYKNTLETPQRLLVRTRGNWSYTTTDTTTAAGVPWDSKLERRKDEIRVTTCNPFSLVAKVEPAGEGSEPEFLCIGGDDIIPLAPGATISFGMNEFQGEYESNRGLIRVELLVSDR